MKLLLIVLFFFTSYSTSMGQYKIIDSLQNILKTQKQDTVKAMVLYNLSAVYQTYKPDSALLYAQEAYNLSVKNNFLKGQSWALNQMAGAFNRLDNYTKALEYYIQQLKIEEQRNNAEALAIIHMNIALVYSSEKDIDKALFYILKSDSIIKKNNLPDLTVYSLLNMGDIYEKANNLPLALQKTLECYALSIKNNDSLIIGTTLTNLGNIYSKSGNHYKAIDYYLKSLPYIIGQQDNLTLSESNLGLAKAYQSINSTDTALQYATVAYSIAQQNGFLKTAMDASNTLAKIFKNSFQFDSAFTYQETMIALKDSLENKKKVKLLESIGLQEKLRQNEIAAQLIQSKKENQQKLQLLAIGILIPIFFLISMYLSQKKVSKKVIEFAGILSLLLLFEYITLFIHPFVAEITHHSPFLEIIIFVCIGALVVPAHHKIEHWFVKRLTVMHEKHITHTVVAAPAAEPIEMVAAEIILDDEKLEDEIKKTD
jgi:tetratricopeptide (TPR) repeat protein